MENKVRFIFLHNQPDGEQMLINVGFISIAKPHGEGSKVFLQNADFFIATEGVVEIKALIDKS